jgi:hypothetical protein
MLAFGRKTLRKTPHICYVDSIREDIQCNCTWPVTWQCIDKINVNSVKPTDSMTLDGNDVTARESSRKKKNVAADNSAEQSELRSKLTFSKSEAKNNLRRKCRSYCIAW